MYHFTYQFVAHFSPSLHEKKGLLYFNPAKDISVAAVNEKVHLQEADEIILVFRVPACMCMGMRLPDQYAPCKHLQFQKWRAIKL